MIQRIKAHYSTVSNVCNKIYKKIRVAIKRYELYVISAFILGIILGITIQGAFALENPKKLDSKASVEVSKRVSLDLEREMRRNATTTTITVPLRSTKTKTPGTLVATSLPVQTTIPSGDWIAQCKIWMQGIIPEEQQEDALFIVGKESKCNYLAKNPNSSATGICQTLIKTHIVENNFLTNPITQMRWCNDYAIGRYGSWNNAKNFWVKNHWW